MARNTQLDGQALPQLAAPYDVSATVLSRDPRQPHATSPSVNIMYNSNGSVRLRPAVVPWAYAWGATLGRVDKLIYFETKDTAVKRFFVASVFQSDGGINQWHLYAIDIDSRATIDFGTGAYNFRTIGSSQGRVHELLVFNGKLYIKAFLNHALGTAVWDGGASTKPWGLLGPTTPAAITNKLAPWTASGSAVAVVFGWMYTYAYKDITGQVSNRAPIQTQPDKAPAGTTGSSNTGSFVNMRPSITVQGIADTTNIPTIVIYRTTDGGGTFYALKEITNTGAGAITFEDKWNTNSAATNTDPLDDATLQANFVAPSLTSNSPPPTCLADDGLVTGTDPTETFTSNMVSFKRRIWFAIKNVLFYSANEELQSGSVTKASVLEASFPSDLLGNFLRFPYKVTQLAATAEALYIVTTDKVYWIRGDSKDSFADAELFGDIGGYQLPPWAGGAAGASTCSGLHTLAITTADTSVVFAARDGKIVICRGAQRSILSDALSASTNASQVYFAQLANTDTTHHQVIQLARLFDSSKDWLIVNTFTAALNRTPDALTGTIGTRMFVYDFNDSVKGWHPVWTGPTFGTSVVLVAQDPYAYLFTERMGLFTVRYKGTSTPGNSTEPWQIGLWSKWVSAGTVATADVASNAATSTYAGTYQLSGMSNPSGNHVNTMRVPTFESVVNHAWLRYQTGTGASIAGTPEAEIGFTYFLDTLSGSGTALVGTVPPRASVTNRSPATQGTLYFPINKAAYNIFPQFTLQSNQTDDIELLDFAVVWDPDHGA